MTLAYECFHDTSREIVNILFTCLHFW